MNCMLEIENKIRGYVSGMELSLGGEQNKVTSRFGAWLGDGRGDEIQQWLKMVPGGVCSNTYNRNCQAEELP